MTRYHTHWNGGRPFRVFIEGSGGACTARVHRYNYDLDNYDETPVLKLRVVRAWIGKSPSGPALKGNSILLQVKDRYVFIGMKVFSFCARAPIKRFVSPVANNDIPYPYAVDAEKNFYLMTEYVMLRNVPRNVSNPQYPYRFYYDAQPITPISPMYYSDVSIMLPSPKPTDIRKFTIGKQVNILWYHPRPGNHYDRLATLPDFGNGMAVYYTDGRRVPLTRQSYIKLLRAHGKRHGFSALKCFRVLVESP